MTQEKDKAGKKQAHSWTCSMDTEQLVSYWCRKSFTSVKSLHIHQTHMKCKQRKEERSEPTSAEKDNAVDQRNLNYVRHQRNAVRTKPTALLISM